MKFFMFFNLKFASFTILNIVRIELILKFDLFALFNLNIIYLLIYILIEKIINFFYNFHLRN